MNNKRQGLLEQNAMENNFDEICGIKFETSEHDFMIGGENKLDIPINANRTKHYYNQNMFRDTKDKYKNTMRSCGLFANMGAISDLTGYKFTDEDILAIQKSAIDDYGLVIGEGMCLYKAVDCVRNYYNTNIAKDKLMSFKVEIGDINFRKAITNNHSIVLGYKTSIDYRNDSQDDGIISKEDYPKGDGHLVRSNIGGSIKIHDNYFGQKKYNTYENNHIVKLVENGVYFNSGYIYLYKDKKMSEQIKDNISLENAKKFFDRGYTSGLNPKSPIRREETMALLEVILQKNNLK